MLPALLLSWGIRGGERAGADSWSLQPLSRPEAPAVARGDWVETPIDAFVLAELEAHGLEPAPPANRETLIRRVTLDLLGLPPAPEEIDAFLGDSSPAAYERLLDRLLASPRYGERWGRHWLDVARFSESHGFEYDKMRENAWRYRDYVIRSFNSDKPYAEFVREQIAGDVMEPFSAARVAATGFLVAGPWDEAGNLQKSDVMRVRAREEELEDMVSAVSQTFLAMTVNCARCHDHKFDPIPQRDYYRIKAVFEGIHHGDRSLLNPEAAKEREAAVMSLKERRAGSEAGIAAIDQAARARITARLAGSAGALPSPAARWTFEGDADDSAGGLRGALRGGARVANGRLILDGKGAFLESEPLRRELREKTLEAWVALANLTQRGGGVLSVETREGAVFDAIVFGERRPGKWLPGSDFYRRSRDRNGTDENAKPGELIHVAISYGAAGTISLYRDGEPYGGAYVPEGEGAGLVPFAPGTARILLGLRHTGGQDGFLEGEIEEARVYDRALSEEEIRASAAAGPPAISPAEVLAALSEEERLKRDALRSALEEADAALKSMPPVPLAYAANPQAPGPTFVFLRGDVEKRGEEVSAAALSAIGAPAGDFGLAPGAPEGLRRLKLAEWMASAENPLAARVMVNRVWHYHFGRGIAASPNDFGASGERPSHPELLDWLAREFIRQGWSLKRLHKLILLSNTFRQSSSFQARAALTDAENRRLWRFAPRRLEAEAVRDAMLSTSGEINLDGGGASFRPFTVEVYGSHLYTVTDREGAQFNRRTVYRMCVNSAEDPMLKSLDCPEPSLKAPSRTSTTTPLQALSLMNNSFVLRQARGLAARILKEAEGGVASQVARAYRLALGRVPSAEEAERGAALIREHDLESLCWVLYNSSEFLYLR